MTWASLQILLHMTKTIQRMKEYPFQSFNFDETHQHCELIEICLMGLFMENKFFQ